VNKVPKERIRNGSAVHADVPKSPLVAGLRDKSDAVDCQRLSAIAGEALNGSIEAVREFFNGTEGYPGRAIAAFGKEGTVLEVSSDRPVLFVGDIHGDLDTLKKVIAFFPPEKYTYMLTGDYVDRGRNGVEVLTALLAFKLCDPIHFIMLRGNHESPAWTMLPRSFPTEFARKVGGSQIDRIYHNLFPQMPIAAVVNGKYLAVHGAIPGDTAKVSDIAALPKEDDERNKTVMRVLWNDFWDSPECSSNPFRGDGIYYIGTDAVDRFLAENRLRLIIRGHQSIYEGYNAGRSVLTLLTTKFASNSYQRVALLRPKGGLELIDVGGYKPVTIMPSYPQSVLDSFQ
jgi:diadenosine tetraphosphatase ApaH/serine/threonine PP2A family protein phosphatase